jgi:O-antigen/teichoic acid export membrane protein
MSENSLFIKGNVSTIGTHILIALQGVLLIPVIIKTSGVELYGNYVLLVSMLGFIFGISSFGVSFRCYRFLPSAINKQVKQTLFLPQFSFHLLSITLLSLFLIAIFPWLDNQLFRGGAEFSLWIIVPYLLFYFLYFQITSYFRYTNKLIFFNYATLTQSYLFIMIVLSWYWVYENIDINLLLVSSSLALLLVTIPLIYQLKKQIDFKLQVYSLQKLMQDIKLGLPLTLNYIVDTIVNIGDRYVIAFFLGATAVGYYNPAYVIGSLIILFAKVSGVVLPALMSKLVDKGDENKAQKMINYTIKGYLLLAIPFVVGCVVFSKPLLFVYTNADISNNSYLIMPIIALGSIFYGLNIILSNVLFVRMKTVLMFRANALVVIVNLVLNLVFLYYFKNIIVAAITTLVSYMVAFLYVIPKVNRQWVINFEIKAIIKSILASLLMGVLIHWYSLIFNESMNDIGTILLGILLGLIVYGVMIFVFKVFSKTELRLLKSIFY